MKIEKILLINSPLDNKDERKSAVNYRSFPPLGLLFIATKLNVNFPDLEIKVIDGDFIGTELIKKEIDSFKPQVMGLSVLSPSYKSALELANFAKKVGVEHIVMGNDHASFFPELILKKHDEISFIIQGDSGDVDFVDLIRALRKDEDPFLTTYNLFGRKNNQIVSSKSKIVSLKQRLSSLEDWPDLKWLQPSLSHYNKNYQKIFGRFHTQKFIKTFIINNAKGCYKANNRCLYCSIFDLKYQWGSAEAFWQAIERYYKNYGINFFFEVCDNFGPLKSYRKELISTMPKWIKDSDIEFMVYLDANTVYKDQEIINDLKSLKVKRVNMSLDSGDPNQLYILKNFQIENLNTKAIEKLTNSGIQIHCSFVMGSLGETEESLNYTVKFIENELLGNEHIIAIEVSPLYPLPKSPAWDIFLGTPEYFSNVNEIFKLLDQFGLKDKANNAWSCIREVFENNDVINLSMASKMWCDYFTFVGYKTIREIENFLNMEIIKSGKISGGFA